MSYELFDLINDCHHNMRLSIRERREEQGGEKRSDASDFLSGVLITNSDNITS